MSDCFVNFKLRGKTYGVCSGTVQGARKGVRKIASLVGADPKEITDIKWSGRVSKGPNYVNGVNGFLIIDEVTPIPSKEVFAELLRQGKELNNAR